MREREAEPVRRATTRVLSLAAALAMRPGPAVGQSTAPGGNAIPPPDVRAADSEGRRDPFVNPLRSPGAPPETVRPRGLAGIAVDELSLRGLVRIAGAHVAVLESGNGRSHLLRGGERLLDGSVRAVTAEGVTIVRHDAGDPPATGGRTVRLTLRAAPVQER